MSAITNAQVNNPGNTQNSRATSAANEIRVDGVQVSWPDDGWYEVQSATSYNTISEGGRSTTLPHGTYNLINHTTGERFENILIGPGNDSTTAFSATQQNQSVHLPEQAYAQDAAPPVSVGSQSHVPENIYDGRTSIAGDQLRGEVSEQSEGRESSASEGSSNEPTNAGENDGPVVYETGMSIEDRVAQMDHGLEGSLEFVVNPASALRAVGLAFGLLREAHGLGEANNTPHTPAHTLTTIDGNRTTVIDYETGVTTTVTRFGEDINNPDFVTITTNTPDVPGAVNGPVTNHTLVVNAQGVIVEDTTVTSPTGGTYRPSSNTGSGTIDTGSSTAQDAADEYSNGDLGGEFGGISPPVAEPVSQSTSTTARPTRDSNRNSDSDTDNGPGGGGVSSSQSASDGGWGSSAGGEFG